MCLFVLWSFVLISFVTVSVMRLKFQLTLKLKLIYVLVSDLNLIITFIIRLSINQINQSINQSINQIDRSANKKINFFFIIWFCCRYESSVSQSLEIRGGVLFKGLALASRATYLVQTFLVLHSINHIPLGVRGMIHIKINREIHIKINREINLKINLKINRGINYLFFMTPFADILSVVSNYNQL